MDFHEEDGDIIRSSRSQMFSKIGALKKFKIFTGKVLCWTSGLQLWSKETPRQVLSCEHIVKILITPFFTEHLWWLLFYHLFSYVSYLARHNFLTWPFLLEEILLWLFRWRFFSYFLIITRLKWSINYFVMNK